MRLTRRSRLIKFVCKNISTISCIACLSIKCADRHNTFASSCSRASLADSELAQCAARIPLKRFACIVTPCAESQIKIPYDPGLSRTACATSESAKLAREHDDANVLCLSAHFMSDEEMQNIIETFISTNFESLERRVRRINRLDEREDYD